MTVRIYHNPRCSKSRQTLALLEQHGHTPEVIEYLKTPLTAADLETLLTQLGMRPREILRKGEPAYKELGLSDTSLSDMALITAMAAHPILIERPIVETGGKAAIGRPPESVLAIL